MCTKISTMGFVGARKPVRRVGVDIETSECGKFCLRSCPEMEDGMNVCSRFGRLYLGSEGLHRAEECKRDEVHPLQVIPEGAVMRKDGTWEVP
jgi:hypothetical protein